MKTGQALLTISFKDWDGSASKKIPAEAIALSDAGACVDSTKCKKLNAAGTTWLGKSADADAILITDKTTCATSSENVVNVQKNSTKPAFKKDSSATISWYQPTDASDDTGYLNLGRYGAGDIVTSYAVSTCGTGLAKAKFCRDQSQ